MNQRNIEMQLYMGLLIEEEHDRNVIRMLRRNIRDMSNPFDIPTQHFMQMFRLDQECTTKLINDVRPHYRQQSSRIPLHIKVLTTLNFMATGSFQNPVGANWLIALSQSSVSRIIANISDIIATNLLPRNVKFPSIQEDKNIVKQGFYDKHRCRGVVGVIDGTHVEILAPPFTDRNHPPYLYINRKGKHAINVMLICDSNSRIIACSARLPGAVYDSAVWQTSQIKRHLRQNYENGDHQTHLLGDSGYPLEPWLFTPFANPIENSPEARYNYELNSARNVIERTNGVLKGRFRCLSRHRTLMYHPTKAANIIYTGCVLHNIAVAANLNLPEEEIEYNDDRNRVQNNVADVLREHDFYNLGRQTRAAYVRNNIAQN